MKKSNQKIKNKRIEKDTMGEMEVPFNAYYGAQTQRAVNNFPISNISFMPEFIKSVVLIKRSAALVNFAGPGWLYVNQSLYFRAPVRIGDTVTTQVKVEKCLSLKHLVELSTESSVVNKIVLTGTATIKSPD